MDATGAIDITTSAGIALLVTAIMQIAKNIYKQKVTVEKQMDELWFKLFIIIIVVILCFLFSYLTFWSGLLETDTSKTAFIRGFMASTTAIGGYKGLQHLFNLNTISENSKNQNSKALTENKTIKENKENEE